MGFRRSCGRRIAIAVDFLFIRTQESSMTEYPSSIDDLTIEPLSEKDLEIAAGGDGCGPFSCSIYWCSAPDILDDDEIEPNQ